MQAAIVTVTFVHCDIVAASCRCRSHGPSLQGGGLLDSIPILAAVDRWQAGAGLQSSFRGAAGSAGAKLSAVAGISQETGSAFWHSLAASAL